MTPPAIWLCPDQVFDGQSLQRGLAVGIANGVVIAVTPRKNLPPGAKRLNVKGVVTPGFLDLQVNGAGNALLNNTPTPQAIATMAAALHRFGTVGILPTVITDTPDVLARAVAAAIETKDTPGFLGLHIEGPHISLPRRGTHAAAYIRPLDETTIRHIQRLRAANVVTKITLAPEAVKPGQVRELVAMGAIVSIGHSDAPAEQVMPLLDEGARCFTHLFNAMSPMQGRAPGVTGAAINSTAFCGFICDGHHVSDAMLGLAIRARPVADRMFVVSDCMSTIGGSDQFSLYGQSIRLAHGRLVNAEGALAGAHVTMAESVARLINRLAITPEQALRMAVTVPAALIGSNLAQIQGRLVDDLLVLGPDWLPIANSAALIKASAD